MQSCACHSTPTTRDLTCLTEPDRVICLFLIYAHHLLYCSQGQKVYFVPRHQDAVGVLDTTTNSFSTISMGDSGNYRYCFAAVVGARIYFAPHYSDDIGVIDTATDTYSTIATGLSGSDKFGGAAAWGTTGEACHQRTRPGDHAAPDPRMSWLIRIQSLACGHPPV